MQFGNTERTGSPANSLKHEACLFTFGTLKLAEALFEFPVCCFDDEKGVIDVRPGIVFALVPAVGALLKGFIVPFLVLFDETLQTDVSADLESQMVALQEQKEPRNTPVSVTERMYAKKIKIKGRQDHRVRDLS